MRSSLVGRSSSSVSSSTEERDSSRSVSQVIFSAIDTESGEVSQVLEDFGWPYRVVFSEDGETVLLPDLRGNELRIVDVDSRQERARVSSAFQEMGSASCRERGMMSVVGDQSEPLYERPEHDLVLSAASSMRASSMRFSLQISAAASRTLSSQNM